MRRKAAAFPGAFSLEPLRRVWTVRQFDEAYTAPHHGFRDATDYYHRASAMRVIDRIRVPTLILTAEDDPFVPVAPFREPDGRRQSAHHARRHARTAATARSWSAPPADYDGYWAEREIVRFADSAAMAALISAANSGPFPDSSCLK